MDYYEKAILQYMVVNDVFSKMASDWLVAALPANQKPGLKILVN